MERNINVWLPFTHPYWGPGLQPSPVPWLGIKPVTLWVVGQRSVHWATPARVITIVENGGLVTWEWKWGCFLVNVSSHPLENMLGKDQWDLLPNPGAAYTLESPDGLLWLSRHSPVKWSGQDLRCLQFWERTFSHLKVMVLLNSLNTEWSPLPL